MEDDIEEGAAQGPPNRARHIRKRALKNKALHVSFDEKDLRDYVTGFHKRKKKRRKEAQKNQEEALRRKRIEQRKKRKLERELALHGGALPFNGRETDESNDHQESEEESEPVSSINETRRYDNGNMQVTVMTSTITQDDEDVPGEKIEAEDLRLVAAHKKNNLAVSKRKSFKKVSKHVSSSKPRKKRDGKGKKMKKKR